MSLTEHSVNATQITAERPHTSQQRLIAESLEVIKTSADLSDPGEKCAVIRIYRAPVLERL